MRGATAPLLAEKIFITSNKHPTLWWPEGLCVGLRARFGLDSDARFSPTATEEMTVPFVPTAMQLSLWDEPVLYKSREEAEAAHRLARKSPPPDSASALVPPLAVQRCMSLASVDLPLSGPGSEAAAPAAVAAIPSYACPSPTRLSESFWSMATPPFYASECFALSETGLDLGGSQMSFSDLYH